MQDDAITQNHSMKLSPVPTSKLDGGSDIKLDSVFAAAVSETDVAHTEQNGHQFDSLSTVINSLNRMGLSSIQTGNGVPSTEAGAAYWAAQGIQNFQSEDGVNFSQSLNGGSSVGVVSPPSLSHILAAQMPTLAADSNMQHLTGRRPITGQQVFSPAGTQNSPAYGNQLGKMWQMSFPQQSQQQQQQQQQQMMMQQNQQSIAFQNWAAQNLPTDIALQRRFPRLNVPSFDKKSFSYTPDIEISALNTQGSKYGRSTSFPGQFGNFARVGFDSLGLQSYDGHFDGSGNFPFSKMDSSYHQSDGIDYVGHSDPDNFKASQYYRGPSDGHLKGARYNFAELPVERALASLNLDPNAANVDSLNERYSRKVFVGGLPPDIDEAEITTAFCHFGSLIVDWPHKAESKSYFPPKGYCFLIFRDELSVRKLVESSIINDNKLYWCVSSPTMKDKPVQIRPWCLADSDFVLDASQPLDPRKTIFVGGVPRPLKALELAMIMNRLYGGVCYAGIDTDPELKYPKGAGRIAFSSQQSYINAISARFIQLQHGDIDKRVEVKPYVLDDQLCDECQGAKCGGKFAPFFCANVTCLQYYCEHCWAHIHSHVGREYHKPLVKEGADRPRAIPFRWGQSNGPFNSS